VEKKEDLGEVVEPSHLIPTMNVKKTAYDYDKLRQKPLEDFTVLRELGYCF